MNLADASVVSRSSLDVDPLIVGDHGNDNGAPAAIPSWAKPDLSVCADAIRRAPPFPRKVLDERWRSWCGDVAIGANAAYDYVAMSLITAASGLIGNSLTVRANSTYVQPSVLWTCLVGKSGAGKTPATDLISEIVDELERRGGTRCRLRDVTVAATVKLASENPKGLTLFRDELSGFWNSLRKNGGEDFWLEAFNGKAFTKDRKNDEPIYIEKLSISMIGGAQPDTVRDITTDGKNRGFSARWLFAYPEPVEGYSGESVKIDLEWATDALERLAGLPVNSASIALSVQAQAIFREWWDRKKRDNADEEGLWADWVLKQGGNAVRIALCLEMLKWCATAAAPLPGEIATETLQYALAFIDDWAIPMADRTLQVMHRSPSDRHAVSLAKFLRRNKLTTFNARKLWRGEYGRAGGLTDAPAVEGACRTLVEACVIRHVGVRNHAYKGRAAKDYEVNPALV